MIANIRNTKKLAEKERKEKERMKERAAFEEAFEKKQVPAS